MGRTITSSFGSGERDNHNSDPFYKRKIYSKMGKPDKDVVHVAEKVIKTDQIYEWDSRNMKHLPDDSVHLMITSPPYNVGKDYEDDLSLKEYIELIHKVMSETHRVLVNGGRACINIANIGRKPYIPLHNYIMEEAHKLGFYMRGEIIWDKGASAGRSCAWGSWKSASNPTLRDVHEYILIFCKSTFKRYPVRQDTISRDDFMECTKSIWRMNTASAKQLKHAAPFPVELPKRLINLYSFHNDIVLDPFMGSGTTGVAAVENGRRYIGYETNKEYVKYANQRIEVARQKQPSND